MYQGLKLSSDKEEWPVYLGPKVASRNKEWYAYLRLKLEETVLNLAQVCVGDILDIAKVHIENLYPTTAKQPQDFGSQPRVVWFMLGHAHHVCTENAQTLSLSF